MNRRRGFVVDILWFTGIAHLIFIAIVPVKGDMNSKTLKLHMPVGKSRSWKSDTECLRKGFFFFFPQIGFKTKSQSTRDWKLSPLSSGAKKLSEFFFVCFMSVLTIWVYEFYVYMPANHHHNRYPWTDIHAHGRDTSCGGQEDWTSLFVSWI